jgi:hypothetical protein
MKIITLHVIFIFCFNDTDLFHSYAKLMLDMYEVCID